MRTFLNALALVTAGSAGLLGLLLLLAINPLIVMWLWNWLLHQTWGLMPAITFWQSLGLVVLMHCIFPGSSSGSDSVKRS